MKAIFSFLENSNYKIVQPVELAALANFCAQKQGFETIFFGNEDSLKKFGKIKYNDKFKLEEECNRNLPKCFWSASKLIALSMMKEPCIHIDMDLLLTKPLTKDFLKNDIICFHDEFFNIKRYERLQNFYKISPQQHNSILGFTYNCGIIGGNDIVTINKGIKILFDFISKNKNYIDNIHFKHPYLPTSVLIEQIWLFQIFKSLNKEITCLVNVKNFNNDYFKMWTDNGYIHFISTRKNQANETIEKIIQKYNIKY